MEGRKGRQGGRGIARVCLGGRVPRPQAPQQREAAGREEGVSGGHGGNGEEEATADGRTQRRCPEAQGWAPSAQAW